MANFSVTAANVLQGSTATILRATAGVSLTAGQVIYLDANRLAQLAGAAIIVSGSPIIVAGICVNSAAAGQQVNYTVLDPAFTPGTSFPSFPAGTGIFVCLSHTPGLFCQPGDLVAGDQVVFLMVPTGSSTANLQIVPSGVVLP
jgi:hypothetical protein